MNTLEAAQAKLVSVMTHNATVRDLIMRPALDYADGAVRKQVAYKNIVAAIEYADNVRYQIARVTAHRPVVGYAVEDPVHEQERRRQRAMTVIWTNLIEDRELSPNLIRNFARLAAQSRRAGRFKRPHRYGLRSGPAAR